MATIEIGNALSNSFAQTKIALKSKAKALSGNLGTLLPRITLGIVLFAHGAQKMFGWFGGYGFTGTMKYFTDTVGLPWILGFLVILFESFGAIALILGLFTRFISFAFAIIMAGVIFTTPIHNEFFMNWFGNHPGEGYEFFLLAIALSLSLVFSGGGKISLDRLLFNKKTN